MGGGGGSFFVLFCLSSRPREIRDVLTIVVGTVASSGLATNTLNVTEITTKYIINEGF